ncbi:ATP-binding protein [Kitasatospora sp. RB6PN24]|uniref:AAA family ATPase n=1 Tax=Kitasatospora humi TaxID=2893891 RepID=UPI001E2AB9E2|nr:ATP-binding protein [Kitasatospora humi]MCC9309549.1 ATP-binding protein [Kitasatospora humi]
MEPGPAAIARPTELFDREAEWRALVDFACDPRPGPSLGLVTGPRRQGKSFLLQALTRATGGFYFGAQEAAEAETLRLLATRFAGHGGKPPDAGWHSWDEALEALAELGNDGPLPVVIDGFPELVRQSPALPSTVQALCRRLSGDRPSNRTRLLLCGSAMPVMSRLLGATFHDTGFRLDVEPLDFRAAARLWDIEDPSLAMRVLAVVGPSPAFRYDLLGDDRPAHPGDFDAWVCRTVLDPRQPLYWKALLLLEREADRSALALCHSTVAAIAAGRSTPGAIAEWLARPATELPRVLDLLGHCGMVAAVPDGLRPAVAHYEIAEPLLAFDHAVIRPNRTALEQRQLRETWQAARPVFEESVAAPCFARICREWAARFAAADTFGEVPGSATPGRLAGSSGHGPVDVDVVVRAEGQEGAPGRLLSVGLADWDRMMDLDRLSTLRQVRARLSQQGEDVSRLKLVCYGAAGFTPELTGAAARGEVILVGPQRLYHGG